MGDKYSFEHDHFYLIQSVIPDNISFPTYMVICGNTVRVIVKKSGIFVSLEIVLWKRHLTD